jgi:hypothetical protein
LSSPPLITREFVVSILGRQVNWRMIGERIGTGKEMEFAYKRLPRVAIVHSDEIGVNGFDYGLN